MPYNANVPLANQRITDTQAPIQGNFDNISSYVAVNHVPFGGAAGEGKHQLVEMPVSGAAPIFAAGETGFYNLYNAMTNENEVFVVKYNSVTGETQNVPMTAALTTQANGSGGYTVLPSGILIAWFQATGTGGTQITIPDGIPPFAFIYNIQGTILNFSGGDSNTAVQIGTYVAGSPVTRFNVYFSSRTTTAAVEGSAYFLLVGQGTF
jgi:hypothetical protein